MALPPVPPGASGGPPPQPQGLGGHWATLTVAQVCARLAISELVLRRMVRDGEFPQPIQIGKERLWLEMDVIAVLHLRFRGLWSSPGK
jgi:predicted DNA-binding transcriptional regulator AlpA